jgi:radical SAM superfamily enzyme YgiQ (UPF0313 family)
MKTVFLQPPDPPEGKVVRDMAGRFGIRVEANTGAVLPPLDFAYAASILEKNGFTSQIIDAPALHLDVQEVLEELLKEKADMIVISTTPVSFKNDLEISDSIKEKLPDTLVCLTGSLVSILPEIALNGSKVDIVVRNEIEFTILDLLRVLGDKRFEGVRGIAYMENGKVVRTPDRALISNLDELPFPAYHLLPMGRYSHNWFSEEDKPFMTMLASRGCPYKCIYCPYPIGYGNLWRGRSAQNVLNEMQFLVDNFHVKSILFRDQVFTFDMKRTEEICRGIVERGIDVKWRCETRVDRLSRKLMTVMKEAGCAGLHLGVESGDPEVLSKIGKPGMNIDKIKRAFADADDLGIETGAFFMIGLPGETKQSVWKSFRLAMDLNPDIISFAAVTPYPGTELYKLAEEKGWILTRDWTRYTGFDVVMRTDDLSEEDILQALKYLNMCIGYRSKNLEKKVFSRKGFKEAFLNPLRAGKWVLSTLKNYFISPQEQFRKWTLE